MRLEQLVPHRPTASPAIAGSAVADDFEVLDSIMKMSMDVADCCLPPGWESSVAQPQATMPSKCCATARRPVLSLANALLPNEEKENEVRCGNAAAGSPPPHYVDFLNAPLTPAAAAAQFVPHGGTQALYYDGGLESEVLQALQLPPRSTCSLAAPVGPGGLPSIGSIDHALGVCKPCAFLHSKGCINGFACKFCHRCGPDEIRRRRKDKIQAMKDAKREIPLPAVGLFACSGPGVAAAPPEHHADLGVFAVMAD